MKPFIAIIGAVDDECTVTLKGTYSRAVEMAGGASIILPFTESEEILSLYTETADGFLFTGGCDIEPRRFGEETLPTCGNIQAKRDCLEFAIFKKAFQQKKPIMAICRGIQVINVALGGTLYQDISTEISTVISHNQNKSKNLPSHKLKIIHGTPLSKIIKKETIQANSFHHQAIKSLGDGLRVMALADDGIIEAVYYNGENYILGYQWHPELLADTNYDNKLLFDSFINACKTKD